MLVIKLDVKGTGPTQVMNNACLKIEQSKLLGVKYIHRRVWKVCYKIQPVNRIQLSPLHILATWYQAVMYFCIT